MDTTETSTKLTKDQLMEAKLVLSRIPVTGLVNQWTHVATFEDVLAHLESVGNALSHALQEGERLSYQVAQIDRDLAGVGRLLKRTGVVGE